MRHFISTDSDEDHSYDYLTEHRYQPPSCRINIRKFSMIIKVTTCLENLEMSGNLTAVREMSGNLLKIREMSGKNLVREKLPKTT